MNSCFFSKILNELRELEQQSSLRPETPGEFRGKSRGHVADCAAAPLECCGKHANSLTLMRCWNVAGSCLQRLKKNEQDRGT